MESIYTYIHTYIHIDIYIYTRTALKVKPISLCWPSMSKACVGHVAVEVEPSLQYSITFFCLLAVGSGGAVGQNSVWRGSAYEAKVCYWIPPCGTKMQPLAFNNACCMVMETKQWIWAHWDGSGAFQQWQKWLSHLHWWRLLWVQYAGSCWPWWRCITNSSDYAEKECFVAENLLYEIVSLCFLHLL